MGEGSVACALGLVTGVLLLAMQRYMDREALRELLTFNPADFFTCGLPLPISHKMLWDRGLLDPRDFASRWVFTCRVVAALEGR